jgi:hypothetical protein
VSGGIPRGLEAHGLGDAEIDELRYRPPFARGAHQDIGGFEVAVDHALLVRVLHGVAHESHQLHALRDGKTLAATVIH